MAAQPEIEGESETAEENGKNSRRISDFLAPLTRRRQESGSYSLPNPDLASPSPPHSLELRRLRRIAGVFGLLGLMQVMLFLAPVLARDVSVSEAIHGVSVPDAEAVIDRSALPEQLDDWQLQDFETRKRTAGHPEGRLSRVWHYRAAEYLAMVSFDYPYQRPHRLTVCYQHLGWQVVREQVAQRPRDENRWAMTEADFVRPSGEHGFLVWGHFDQDGNPLQPHWVSLPSYASSLLYRVGNNALVRLFTGGHSASYLCPTACQVQLFVYSPFRVSDQQRAHVRSQFLKSRDRLRRLWIERSSNEP